jgi:translation initiation factor eIF-2B subunit epsilon
MSNRSKIEQEEKLHAVLLLDSYTNDFKPFSSKRAECLMPFFGTDKTLLDHNIQYLIDSGVEEITLFCTFHHHQIRSHIKENKKNWDQRVEIHFIYNFECQSVGDALREIDDKGIVRTNFILLTASAVITNINLKERLAAHLNTVKTVDKSCIMSILCTNKKTDLNVTFTSDYSFVEKSKTFIVHNSVNKVLHYDKIMKKSSKNGE